MTRLTFLFAALCVLACGDDTVSADGAGATGGGGDGGAPMGGGPVGPGPGSGGSPMCAIDGPGQAFTFSITNTGPRQLHIPESCGSYIPIEIGGKGLGVENADFCANDCVDTYSGVDPSACSDCGPGTGQSLPPGNVATIV